MGADMATDSSQTMLTNNSNYKSIDPGVQA